MAALENTFRSLYDTLKKLEGDKLDTVLKSIEKSLRNINVYDGTVNYIMDDIYDSFLTDAIKKNQTNKLKYFLDRYYSCNNDENYNYDMQNIYIFLFNSYCKTDKKLHLFKFLIKCQIKNQIQHDDCDVGYDRDMCPNFVKYLYNISYIVGNPNNYYNKFNLNKLNL